MSGAPADTPNPPPPSLANRLKRTRKFSDDIEEMLYGFGDAWPPNNDTVALIETLATQYIEGLLERSDSVAERRGRLDKECFMYLVAKDRPKFYRIHRLIKANEVLKKVREVEFRPEEDPHA